MHPLLKTLSCGSYLFRGDETHRHSTNKFRESHLCDRDGVPATDPSCSTDAIWIFRLHSLAVAV